ncbi:LPXTG cell wall anchor domain-containing protein [Brevibacterium ravenspurgense]|uniref:LPXTG cell wall anchor domain-containing protein n=1 Tax=Brevibacterium ravenspurgense TaxID=479117 RepID=UPI0002D56B5C|nr:LPXTG cell wall anchor domain-containing protein [Brevibacterium ravenspurgense]
MKTLPSLVLAPAVAAVTGFAAVPAFAAPGDQAPDTASGQNPTSSSSDSEEGEVSVSLAQDSIAAEQIADSKQGLKFTGTGFTPGDKATVTVIGTDGISYTPDTKLAVSQAGEVKGSYFFSTDKGSKVPEGSYRLFLTDLKTNEATELAKFTVGDKTEDTAEKPAEDEQQAKPEGSAKPEGASESTDSASTPVADKSADASASPSAQPSETPSPAPSQTTQSAQPSETSTPSETPSTSASPEPSDSPSATETAKPEDKAGDKKDEAVDKAAEDKADEKQDDADNKSDEADKPKVTEDQLPTSTLSFSKNRVEDTDFTLSKDEVAQVEVGEKASKQQKEAAQKKSEEFAKEGKGVTLTLKNGLPGAEYVFKVQQPGTAKPFELPAKTDSAGTASVWIYEKGTAATGTYKVTVEGAKAVVSDKADDADKETAKPSEAPTAGAGSITPSSTPSSETTVSATATPSPTTEADKKDDAAKDSSDKKTESTAAESNEKLDWNEVRKLDKDKTSNVKIEKNAQVAAASFTVFKAAPEPKPEPEQQKPTTPADKPSAAAKDPSPATDADADGMNEKPKAPEAENPEAEGDADQTEDGAKQKPENNGQAESEADNTAGDQAGDAAEDGSSEADQSDQTDQTDQTDQSEQTMTSEQEQEDTSGAEQRRELPNTTPDDHYAQSQESTGSTGSQLPRTGGDLTGLALGAGLVVVGAASIVVTRRKVSGI